MDTNDSYTIVFTNEMLKSIGIDTNNENIEVEITIENGSIKVLRKKDAI
jgi:hypothetical protein